LLICVLPTNAAVTTKSTMIGARVRASLAVVVPFFHISSFAEQAE
jgi:hypothetical protein